MHVDLLSITFLPVNNCGDQHQCVLGHEIPYASFPPCVCGQIKFECPGNGEEGKREEGKEERVACHYGQRGEMSRAPLTVGYAGVEKLRCFRWTLLEAQETYQHSGNLIPVSLNFPCALKVARLMPRRLNRGSRSKWQTNSSYLFHCSNLYGVDNTLMTRSQYLKLL